MPKPIDLTGERFGRFVVVGRAPNNKDGRTMWKCICDCGNERVVMGKCLRNGHTQSCGCLNREITSDKSLKNRVGERFGRLVVVERSPDYVAPNGKHHVRWLCQCDCGKQTVVDACSLSKGHTQSCGCLKSEIMAASRFKHGGRNDRLYKVYANMKDRCYNPNSPNYPYYGERGIRICDEWLQSYSTFKDWAMKTGYLPDAAHGECTIDRIDVNGNYEPSNCQWVDMAIQARNRRNVISKSR